MAKTVPRQARRVVNSTPPPLLERRQNLRYGFAFWLRGLWALAVETDAHRANVQAAATDDEHGLDTRSLAMSCARFKARPMA